MKRVRHLFGWVLLTGAGIALTGAPPAPEIYLSLRGIEGETAEQGEPLHVVVRLNAPREAAAAISLSPASGAWSEAVSVEFTRVDGEAALVRAVPLGRPDSPVATLDAGHVAGGLWRFSPESMRGIAPGSYVVRARLAIRNGTGWIGEIVSDETPLQIVAPANSTDGVSQRAAIRARDAMLDGRGEEAATVIDAVLVRTPDDQRLLDIRAELALQAGNPMAAMICLNRASHQSGSGQPDIEREELKTRALAALYREGVPPANPPNWSWPPASVLAMSEPNSPTPVESPTATGAAGPNSQRSVSTGVGIVVPSAELADTKIIADSAGQWAASAVAGSQYGKSQYSAAQATGAPNISVAGNSPDAWCPANKASGTDWLEVTFAKPVHATEVRVRQNDAAGAIAKVEAIGTDGTAHVWWEGVDPYVAPATRDIAWFAVRVPATDYLVAKVKLTLNLAAIPGWKEIDAVQLVGTAQ